MKPFEPKRVAGGQYSTKSKVHISWSLEIILITYLTVVELHSWVDGKNKKIVFFE